MNVRNDYDGAERCFRRAIDLDPAYPWARNNLGLLLYEVVSARAPCFSRPTRPATPSPCQSIIHSFIHSFIH
jgi:hypothetical protein